jgi:hypothetical protein
MNIVGLFKRIDRLLSWFFVTLLVIGVTVGCFRVYLNIPDFLFEIKDKIKADAALVSYVGEIQGEEMKFSDSKLTLRDSASFFVSIKGACDSNYVRVTGKYKQTSNGITYVIRDTVFSHQCP